MQKKPPKERPLGSFQQAILKVLYRKDRPMTQVEIMYALDQRYKQKIESALLGLYRRRLIDEDYSDTDILYYSLTKQGRTSVAE